jgi:structural maintenance of chromosome 2
LELDSLESEVEIAHDAFAAAETNRKLVGNDALDIEVKVGNVKAQYEEAKRVLDDLDERMSLVSAEVVELKHARSSLEKLLENATLEVKKLSVNVNRIKKDRANAENVAASLKKKYTWIESEMSAFGKVGGEYDFENVDSSEMQNRLAKLKTEQEHLVSSCFRFTIVSIRIRI